MVLQELLGGGSARNGNEGLQPQVKAAENNAESARHGDALLLTARESIGRVPGAIREPEVVQQFHRPRAGVRRGTSLIARATRTFWAA